MSEIQKDGRSVQFLLDEVKRHGRAQITLAKVLQGLISVHNQQIIEFIQSIEGNGK